MFGAQLHGCATHGWHRISAREATADVDCETVVVSCTHIHFRFFRRLKLLILRQHTAKHRSKLPILRRRTVTGCIPNS
eukprot:254361-Pyramimonas_sp.AAC.1